MNIIERGGDVNIMSKRAAALGAWTSVLGSVAVLIGGLVGATGRARADEADETPRAAGYPTLSALQRRALGSFWREQRGASESVVNGLSWLVRHQAPSGGWEANGWATRCEQDGCPASETGLDGRFDVGLTSLAVAALLPACEPSSQATAAVQRALRWLCSRQAEDGGLGWPASLGEGVYNHALATRALCDALRDGVGREVEGVAAAAEAAVARCLAAQGRDGGWGYTPARSDSSVTGVVVKALHAARRAGLAVPAEASGRASDWLRRATDARGVTGYVRPGDGSSFLPSNEGRYDPSSYLTALAANCRALEGDAAAAAASLPHLMAAAPTWSDRTVAFLYWYEGTRVVARVGTGDDRRAWSRATLRALKERQHRGGCGEGSWDPVDEWGAVGGRVYATAVNVLTLEVPLELEAR